MSKWEISNLVLSEGKRLLHECGETNSITGKKQSYFCFGWLDTFYCVECQSTAPQEMVDLALLAGVKANVMNIYDMQFNAGFKVLLRALYDLEKKVEELSARSA